MRYQGSEAYSMDVRRSGGEERLERRAAPSFEVVTGGGLDARRARRRVGELRGAGARWSWRWPRPSWVLGMARVGIAAATVSLLSANSALSTPRSRRPPSLNEQLRVQRSDPLEQLRASTRIATQNYGMVLTGDAVTVDLGSAAEGEAADGDAAQTGDADPGAGRPVVDWVPVSSRDRQSRRGSAHPVRRPRTTRPLVRGYRVRAARPGGVGVGRGRPRPRGHAGRPSWGSSAVVAARLAYLQIFKHGELLRRPPRAQTVQQDGRCACHARHDLRPHRQRASR